MGLPHDTGAGVGARIEVRGLTKRFGDFTAVQDLDFAVEPGRITGFLGPNGAGKTTTLRMLLGLIRPTAGTATIGGVAYHDIPTPLLEVGSALESTNFHPGRSGRDHLRVLAATSGIPDRRVDEMLELVGIPAAARKRAGGYSMGMRQRLGLAAALLGDPKAVILDEPSNGLDPEGIRWLRGFLRYLSGEGKTVLISSHLLAEVSQTVDDVVIIANGAQCRAGPDQRPAGRADRAGPDPGPRRAVQRAAGPPASCRRRRTAPRAAGPHAGHGEDRRRGAAGRRGRPRAATPPPTSRGSTSS